MECLLKIMALLEFAFIPDPCMSDAEIAKLAEQTRQADQAIEDLVQGNLAMDDAIALCESLGCDPDQTINDLISNLKFLECL